MRLSQLVVDCADPAAQSGFWAALLGGAAVDRGYGWWHAEAPGFPVLAFQPVPERKAAKNRLHLDVAVADVPTAVAAAVGLGAEVVGAQVTDDQGTFQVLRDPEGNEFCFVSG